MGSTLFSPHDGIANARGRGAATSCQAIADELFQKSRETPEAEAIEFSDEDLLALSAILNQPLDKIEELCR